MISVHSLTDPVAAKQVIAPILQHLRQPEYFETALPLYRRLQFGRFLESSHLFTNRTLDRTTNAGAPSNPEDFPWLYAFVDRGCRPETEVWLFGSWEVEAQSSSSLSSTNNDQPNGSSPPSSPHAKQIQSLLLALTRTIKSLPTPPSIHPSASILTAQTQLASPPSTPSLPDPNTMLWGAIHARTLPHLQALDLLATHLLPITPNHTFLFPLETLPPPAPLPPNLRWGRPRPEHFPLIRSRTGIARQDFTLARLPGLAIFPADEEDAAPVAWAFVGLDGSLTTLHAEESHRRMGLGRALSAKLFREEMGRFWEEGVQRVAHGNVVVGNEASAAMCGRLGGREGEWVYWVMVDLGGR